MKQSAFSIFAILAVAVPLLNGCSLVRNNVDCAATEPYHFAREVGPVKVPDGMVAPAQRADRRIPDINPTASKSIGKCLEKPPVVLSNESMLALKAEGVKEPKGGQVAAVRPWPVLSADKWTNIDALSGADLRTTLQPGLPAWRVHDLLQAWAAAWSDNEKDAYFAFYAGSFIPENGLTWDAWRNQRMQKMLGENDSSLSVYGAEAQIVGTDNVAVRFNERYSSVAGTSVARKEMLLVREADVWSIKREREIL